MSMIFYMENDAAVRGWSAYATRVGPLPWAANAVELHSTT